MKGGPVPRFGVEQMSNQSAHGGRDGRGSRLATPGAMLGAERDAGWATELWKPTMD